MTSKNDNWINIIVNAVKTAQSVGIDSIIIEPDWIRGCNEAKTVVIFQNEDVPSLSVGSIGMSRIGTFMQRYNIISNQDNPTFKADVDSNKGYVRSIVMSSSDTKIEYRCANPETIQAPKKIFDTTKYRVLIPINSGAIMKQAQAAMNSEIVEIASDKTGTFFKILDINNDDFKHILPEDAVTIDDDDAPAKFAHKYALKNVLDIIDPAVDTMFEIGERGVITTSVNGLNVLILPKV
jgi:hypothetical protein